MLANLNGWHAVILLVIILLLFGAPKLPGLAKSLGQSMKIFKSEIKTPPEESNSDEKRPSDEKRADENSDSAAAREQTTDSQSQHKP